MAPEVNADVIPIFFPTQIGKIVGKIHIKFSRTSEKRAKVSKIVEKIWQTRLRGHLDPGVFNERLNACAKILIVKTLIPS